ncbi:hypothetical protein EAO73_06745 [Streptomyces sp. col6]|nr:hypothetical protein EAO73_06745 [Streptomyces sp. col6]
MRHPGRCHRTVRPVTRPYVRTRRKGPARSGSQGRRHPRGPGAARGAPARPSGRHVGRGRQARRARVSR